MDNNISFSFSVLPTDTGQIKNPDPDKVVNFFASKKLLKMVSRASRQANRNGTKLSRIKI